MHWRVVEPDELVDPDRPERQTLVPGTGRQRLVAVNDHWAGHCVVSAAPCDDAPARRPDVAVPARRLAEGKRHHKSSRSGRADAQRCGGGAAGLTAAMLDDPDDGHVPAAGDPQYQRVNEAGDGSDHPSGAWSKVKGI